MEPRHIIRAAIAVSVVGHLALAVGVFFADARPFDASTTRDISVDIVTPQQVAAAAQPADPTPPKPDKTPDPFRLPELTDKPKPDDPASAAAQPSAPSPSAAQQPAAQQQQQQQSSSAPPPPAEQAAAQQQAASAAAASSAAQAAQAQPQQQAALQPPDPQTAPPPEPVPRAEPDVTVKYGVMLGLPNGNGGSEAIAKADIAPLDIEAFRRHLRSCATLPAAVSRGDKVRIVLRAFLTPDGRLLTEPSLIEASASVKGPLLMQAAMQALQACQPYAMLPADRYKEWKVLDLAFTPQDFAG